MKRADVDAVLEIERRAFESPWQRAHFLHEILDNRIALNRVVTHGERIVGYACVWCVSGELKINNIVVADPHRRRGLGRWILRAMLDEGRRRGCESATLEVRPSNIGAIELYRSHGFVEVGRRKNYYSAEGEDAILMTADLATDGPSGRG